MPTQLKTNLPPLPKQKTPINILADFLGYLLTCAQTFIESSGPNGPQLWSSTRDNIQFIISHPNGWEGAQQAVLRQAAIKAGLVTTDTAQERVHFVTEGEASLHFCYTEGILEGLELVGFLFF